MKKSIRKSFLVPVLVALVGVLVVCQSQAQFAYITNTGSITITGYAGYGGVVVTPPRSPASRSPPEFTGVSGSSDGAVNLSVARDVGLLHVLEASTDLVKWSWLGVRSNATGNIQFSDLGATNYASRFYRVSVP